MTKPRTSERPTAILASPGSVDGYPPVQAQARLLADAQFQVELVTTRFPDTTSQEPHFRHPGVNITVAADGGKLRAAGRMAAFIASLAQTRRRARKQSAKVVEIAYDPTGILYSDYAPFRPRIRIAHFHEHLVHFDALWRERRLPKAIAGFDRVVVPDAARGNLLKAKLALPCDPMVVPNYPILESFSPDVSHRPAKPFEVIYSGSIGYDQKIDFIASSVREWPAHARLTIIGLTNRPAAQSLRRDIMAERLGDRVRFEDWLDFSALPERLSKAHLGISLLTPTEDQWQSSLGASNKRYLYMKAGLPQIGDMNPGVTELLEGRNIGRCLREFDTRQLATLIASYAHNSETTELQGRRALELHRTEFNYNLAFAPLLREIELLIGRPPTDDANTR